MLLLAGLLVSIFAGILATSTPVYAADAVWDASGNIDKDGTVHRSVTNKSTVEDMGFAADSLVFASDYDTSQSAGNQTVSTISFAPGTDLRTANSATLSEFSFTPPSSWDRTSQSQTVVDGSTYSQVSTGSNCQIEQIGWMVCGPSVWIANGVDTIYGWIEDFLTVRELEVNNQSSTLYQAWNVMRGIANAAFIIAFLIIIYSQVSSLGISNYGIKKLAPRLIIAALIVNLSFYICAIGIDLSNALGYSLKQFFDDLYSSLITTGTADNEGIASSASIVQAVISGGTLLIGGGIAVGGSLLAAAPLLLPLLLTVFVALLVALVVFAVRQALIIILVIIAPLAFVCYLLPGTEKWFEKWRSTFFTMLFFFPAFAVVFGGAKLAGMLIITNASTIVMAIIGWAVQLAPLALAPLVMKLGGGVLNRIAGIVNDPSKGIIDRSKQWADNKSKVMAANSRRRLEENEKRRDNRIGRDGQRRGRKWYDSVKPYGMARRMARYADTSSRLLKDQVSESEKALENSYHGTKKYMRHDIQSKMTGEQSELLAQQASNRFEEMKTSGSMPDELKTIGDKARARLDSAVIRADGVVRNIPVYDRFVVQPESKMDNLTNSIQSTHQQLAIESLRKNSIQRVKDDMLAVELEGSDNLRKLAGQVEDMYFTRKEGVESMRGSQRALSSALQTVSSANQEAMKNATVILEHGNYTDTQIGKIANGRADHGTNLPITTDLQKAAMHKIYGGANTFDFVAALKEVNIPAMTEELRQELGDILLANSAKPAWVGAVNAAAIKNGTITLTGQAMLNDWMTTAVENNKFSSADKLVSQDATYLKELAAALPSIRANLPQKRIDEITTQILTAKKNPNYRGRIGERRDHIESMYNFLRQYSSDPSLPRTYDDIEEDN